MKKSDSPPDEVDTQPWPLSTPDFITFFDRHSSLLQGSRSRIPLKSSSLVPKLMFDKNPQLCLRCASLDFDQILRRKVASGCGVFLIDLKATVRELLASKCPLCNMFGATGQVGNTGTSGILRSARVPRRSGRNMRWSLGGHIALGERKIPDSEVEKLERPIKATLPRAAMISRESVVGSGNCYLHVFSAKILFTGMWAGSRVTADPGRDTMLLGVNEFNKRSRGHSQSISSEYALKRSEYLAIVPRKQEDKPLFHFKHICPELFDAQFARNCIEYCQTKHPTSCKKKVGDMDTSSIFKLIDCTTGLVVTAPPNCEYAALSYVWADAIPNSKATNINQQGKQHLDPGNFPGVIQDSIQVASMVGVRYLWVDQYCINQMDADEKRHQIRQMDVIYANAKFTIVAATSNGQICGLPGVSGILRKPQLQLNVRDYDLISTLSCAISSTRQSRWATRGWTYQEGILSNRCLIFTDEQVIFQCNGMYCEESIGRPLDDMHDRETAVFDELVPEGPLGRKAPGLNPFDVMSYIVPFTKRTLTFKEDRIRAMNGIFHAYERCQYPVYHIMGVSVLPPVRPHDNSMDLGLLRRKKANAYTWLEHTRAPMSYESTSLTPTEGFLAGLTWFCNTPGTRERTFPSWTWAGWTGDLSERRMFDTIPEGTLSKPTVWIESDDGDVAAFPDEESLPGFILQIQTSTFIHIEAYTFSCHTFYFAEISADVQMLNAPWPTASPTGQHVRVLLEDQVCLFLNLTLDRKLMEHDRTGMALTAVVMGSACSRGTGNTLFYVEESGENMDAERIGIGEVSFRPGYHSLIKDGDTWAYLSPSQFKTLIAKQPRRKIRIG